MLNCLIVEDEPLAATVLEHFIRQMPRLRLTGKCADAIFALEAMQQSAVDVLFLDIHLPGLKGLEMLRVLPYQPQVILTTAYHEYALDSYDYGVTDYLLKPIDFERFVKAVQKLKHPETAVAAPQRAFHFFNVNKKMIRVWIDEISVVESLKEYVKLHLNDGSHLITRSQVGEMEQWLGAYGFQRVHRSFLVNTSHIEAYTATTITVGGLMIPIGRQYKTAFLIGDG